ncbi:uncharacterized protein ELE39_001856 [Cryptosporidium sp. chipmunk genotype I]|uniref:uncharacterized protein n=1 Tax=Cryptosporidium sp. chipmunk genotype I TaxID=1280935 RepID=UPI00351A2619|nr:hypothetical protein ELE39_001856 [Cryptosporidium sp. chipmunk genotype I]
MIGLFNANYSFITSLCKKNEYQYTLVLESISILKIRASIPSSEFCPKCGSRIYRTKCLCSSIGDLSGSPGPSSRADDKDFGRRGSKSKKAKHRLSKGLITSTTTHHPLSRLQDPVTRSRLISEKNTEIQTFKNTIREIKASIDVMLLMIISDCAIIFTRQFSRLDSDELKEALLEVLTDFAGMRFLESHITFLLTKEELYRKVGSNALSIEDLEAILESCLNQSYTLINNLASMYDKKAKIKELKQEIEILKTQFN